ncbi:hypothetical protein NL676_002965 [Syzygium grande]|nr:hypothetical protein NL676_002965 [Syzygium grande]
MGVPGTDTESSLLLPGGGGGGGGGGAPAVPPRKAPDDAFQLAYIIFFTVGLGFLLPWNAFITAVDYFAYLYPDASVDRVFAVVYMLVALASLLVVIFYSRKSDAAVRINLGLALFIVALLVVPIMDVTYIKGRVGLYDGFYVTVAATGLCGLADALVQGGIIGSAGEMPERYMQAVVAGTAASGVLISLLRVITKAAYTQDAHGLRRSANLYFAVGIAIMVVCLVLYNVAHRLPVMKYYKELKMQAVNEEKEEKGSLIESACSSTLWDTVGRIKWTEIPVTILTCLLGLTNGYLTSVLMILAPKVVQLQHAETAGIVVVLFLVLGLAIGSVVAWFWVI